jgi:hypothetical protein
LQKQYVVKIIKKSDFFLQKGVDKGKGISYKTHHRPMRLGQQAGRFVAEVIKHRKYSKK